MARTRHLIPLATLTMLSLWFWHGSLDDFFAQDDFLLLADAVVKEGSWSRLFAAMLDIGPVDNMYRPISTTLYFFVMHKTVGLSPLPYHLVNVLLHTGSSLLIYALLWRLLENRLVAWMAGLFFATRSLSYVAVYWVAAVQVQWVTFFCLLSVLLGVDYVRGGRRRLLAGSLVAFGLAMGCKGDALALPGCALFVAVACQASRPRRVALWFVLLASIAVAFLGWMVYVARGHHRPYVMGPPRLELIGKYLEWAIYGMPTGRDPPAITALVIPALAVLPLLFPGQSARRTSAAALLLLMGGSAMALPTILLRDRLTTYYAYLPVTFFIMAAAVGIRWLPVAAAMRPRIHGLLVIVVLCSAGYEFHLNTRKDQTPFVFRDFSMSRTVVQRIVADNADFVVSGGWLNTAKRAQVQTARSFLPQLRPVSAIVLTNWDEIYVTANSKSEPGTLEPVSSTEAMFRLFGPRRDVVLRFLVSDYDASQNDGQRRYKLAASQLQAFVDLYDRDVMLLVLRPQTADLLGYADAKHSSVKQMLMLADM